MTATIVTGTAANTLLNVFDTVDLGAGTDTLNVNYGGTAATVAASAVPLLTGVEVLNLTSLSGASTLNGTITPDLTTLSVTRPVATAGMTVSNAPSTLTTFGLNTISVNDNDLSVTYATGTLAGSSDAVTLNATGVSSATTGTATTYPVLALIGPASGSGVEVVNVVSSSTSRLDDLTSTDSVTQTMTTLNVSGAGSFRVNTALNFKGTSGTINASNNSGGINLVVGTENLTITGGSGNDVITFGAAGDLDVNDSLNLGAGTRDKIILADTAVSSTTTALNTAINASTAEVIGFSAAASVDMSQVSASLVAMSSTTNVALTVTKLLSTDTVIVDTGTDTGADLTVSGQLGFTTANLELAGSSTASVSIDDLTAQSLATVGIVSNGTFTTANTLDNLILSDNAVVTITGAQALTITNPLANTAVVIDGSGMGGALSVTAGTSASSLVGGAGNDTLVGGTGADTFVGGAGDDTLSTGADGAVGTTITGGTGADTINLQHIATNAATTAMNVTAAESYATVSRFDTINVSDIAAQAAAQTITFTTGVTTTSLSAATSATVGTTLITAGGFLIVNSGGSTTTAGGIDSTIYQDSNSNGTLDATDLRVDINIVGATDTGAFTISSGKLVYTIAGV